MSHLTRLFICLMAYLTLWILLWPGQVEARPLNACSTNVTVTNASNSGAGSLRQALADVCSGGIVDFAAGLANQTITLTSAELSITKTVTITNPNAANLKVSGNNARRVFNIQPGAVVTISSLSIINGAITGSNGGGILNNGALALKNSSVSSNTSTYDSGINDGGYGGGISNNGRLSVDNSTLNANSSFNGGGIYNLGVLTITHSIFRDHSVDGVGGGIMNDGSAAVTDTTFNSNLADSGGGGIQNGDQGILTVSQSTFYSNSTFAFGGGIFSSGILTLNNSTLSGNLVGPPFGEGGGIYNYFGVLTIKNSSLTGNSAPTAGGGILNEGDLYLYNSLVANSPDGGDCYNREFINANVNNLIEDGSCNPTFSGDPNLGPLANNGGSTLTHALLAGSPAIDAGNNATCLATDQRGVSRPLDGNGDSSAVCDIGAVEVSGAGAPIVQFAQATYTTNESVGTSQSIVLTRSGNLNNASQVQVSLNGGTASAGTDYSSAGFPKTVTFGNGVVSQTVSITIVDDTDDEPMEIIGLSVSSLSNATIGAQNNAILQLEDNDPGSSPALGVYLPMVVKEK